MIFDTEYTKQPFVKTVARLFLEKSCQEASTSNFNMYDMMRVKG